MADTRGQSLECDLLIKNLPRELSHGDKEDLLQYFGAKHVVCMGARGKMRNAAYATFSDSATAKQALSRLHQLEVLGQKLVVEFAKQQHKDLAARQKARLSPRPSDAEELLLDNVENSTEAVVEKRVLVPDKYSETDKVSQKFGLNYNRNKSLHYVYPPPNVSIITNIANTLICVPKFYVQVLHLMNKMNLPAPFGLMTVTPPFSDAGTGHVSSSEESEIESDTENKTTSSAQTRKRPATVGTKPKVKRLRVEASQLLHQPATVKPTPSSKQKPVQSVFEQAVGIPQHSNRIGVKLADSISAIFEAGPQQMVSLTKENKPTEAAGPSGFGTFAPTSQDKQQDVEEDEEDEEEDVVGEFISLNELRRNKIGREEAKSLSAFKKYECGEPTCRLYIKNLSKQVEIKDLRHVFGRFIDQTSEHDKESFDVRLMKDGRMKGQAFVNFPDELSAEKALRETHRYLLLGKPLVVQFARSAKPKD